ncbi:adenine phosphoribosyltransferase, partial [Alphaproteobacteria bacterium]|nr:adenine phosphoribosyltransferase [Alphaproteobacteria bacterium]
MPVIHVLTHDQAAANIDKLVASGIRGCFLINHDFDVATFLPIIRTIRAQYPDFWIGVNFLAISGGDAFPILAELANAGCLIDAYWADDARIDERKNHQTEAERISQIRQASDW